MGEKVESGEGLEHGVQVDLDKDKAYLHDSDSEMSEALPQEMVVAEELDEVVTSFEELDLETVDLPEATEDGPEPAIELLDASQAEDGMSERPTPLNTARMTLYSCICGRWGQCPSCDRTRRLTSPNAPNRQPKKSSVAPEEPIGRSPGAVGGCAQQDRPEHRAASRSTASRWERCSAVAHTQEGPISFASGKGAQAGRRPAGTGQAPGHECSDQTARPPRQTTID